MACNKQFYCIIMKGINRTFKICPTVRNPIRPSFSATNSVLWVFIFLSPCSEKLGSGRGKFNVFSNHKKDSSDNEYEFIEFQPSSEADSRSATQKKLCLREPECSLPC